MAKSQNEIIGKSLNKVKERIIQELATKNIDATGQLSNSLQINNTAFGATLTALEYLPTSFDKVGIRPGSAPFISVDWVRVKGIHPRDFKTGRFISYASFAFLVSQKIKREGTDRYSNKREGVDIKTIMEEERPQLKKDLTLSFKGDFTKTILSISKSK